jgi:uncharacterized repeat protein (TIGR03803 family)
MQSRASKSTTVTFTAAITLLLAATVNPSQLAAQDRTNQPSYRVLYTFPGGTGGSSPIGLAGDGKGNFYGVTNIGGDLSCGFSGGGCGVVFQVDAKGNETVRWAFTGGADGNCIFCGSDVVPDSQGNVYGGSLGGIIGAGLVYKIDPSDHFTVLYSFKGGNDGYANFALPIIRDEEGNIYGTTDDGGTAGLGVVFKLDPSGNETVLHSFTGGSDGENSYSALARDRAGNLYGTTFLGGANGAGVVYKVDPNGNENVLYTYTASSGGSDTALLLDREGNLYGKTPGGLDFTPPGFVVQARSRGK